MNSEKKEGFMMQAQEALPEQFTTFFLSLEKIAQCYFMAGQLDQALQLFQSARQLIYLPEVTQRDQARFLLHYGDTLTARALVENASIEEALATLEEAKQFATQIADEQLIADTLDTMGYARYIAASNKRESRQEDEIKTIRVYFQDALERRKMLHDERGTSESLFHLGLIADVLDQKEVADASYTQALQIARQHGYLAEASYVLRHLGFHEQKQGNFARAQEYLTESLHLREQIGMRIYLPFSYVVLADICLAQGQIDAASAYCQKALELSKAMNIKKALIFSLASSGLICQKKQEDAQARKYFEQVYAAAQAINLEYAMQEASAVLQCLSTTELK